MDGAITKPGKEDIIRSAEYTVIVVGTPYSYPKGQKHQHLSILDQSGGILRYCPPPPMQREA